MGNAAAAYGALAAGVNLICGYPGTPSSELLETAAAWVQSSVAQGELSPSEAPHVEWSVNEKAALEVAFGASLSGARALVTMKQVGLNVAADPLLTLAYLGVKAGLVLFVADDPGPLSSQTEQDTRQFAQFAKVPILDAATPEELNTMMTLAFDFSERHHTPVILRSTTRVCHGSAAISPLSTYQPHTIEGFKKSPEWVIFPPLAYKAHKAMPEQFEAMRNDAVFASLNYVKPAKSRSSELGIIAGGISWAYLLDALDMLEKGDTFDLMKIGAPFPFDDERAAEFLSSHECILVFEELEPTIERELLRVAGARQLQVPIKGKLTGTTPSAGENSVEYIAALIETLQGRDRSVTFVLPETPHTSDASDFLASSDLAVFSDSYKELLLPRPPVLCAGCPHRASFYAVKKAMRGKKAYFSGDIGCYTLGNILPLKMVDTCVCMGAGFTVPQGMFWAEPDVHHFGFVGDSTFFASGLTGVVNAVYNQAALTLIVLDNSITAMTGAQPHPGTGIRMSYDSSARDAARAIDIPRVLKALGVSVVAEVNPFETSAAIAAIKTAVEAPGVTALVFKAPCITLVQPAQAPHVDTSLCSGCGVCIDSIGCPSLALHEEGMFVEIGKEHCTGCDLCVKACPFSALVSNNV